MKSYLIHLIRHGITAGNETGRYVGSTDLPLSAAGVRQIQKLAAAHAYPQVQAYFAAPQKRCVQTLRLLYPQAKPIEIPGFRECDFGRWEGKSAAEIASEDPKFAQWVSGNGKAVTPPGGESGGVFMQRVCAAFEKVVEGMLRSGVTSAAAVVPGGALMAILSTYGLPRAKFYDWMAENGCGYSMRITPGLWMRSMVGEVYAKVPADLGKDSGASAIDLGREAADRAFGPSEPGQGDGREKPDEE